MNLSFHSKCTHLIRIYILGHVRWVNLVLEKFSFLCSWLKMTHIRTCQNISEHIRTYQNISEHTRTYQNISKHIRTYQNISEPVKRLPCTQRAETRFQLLKIKFVLIFCTRVLSRMIFSIISSHKKQKIKEFTHSAPRKSIIQKKCS